MSDIKVSSPPFRTSKELEPWADEAIAEFDNWFQEQGNSQLTNSERSILKTWLYFKLVAEGKKNDGEEASNPSPV